MKKYIITGECVPKATPAYNRYGGAYGKSHERQVKYEHHVWGSLAEQGAKPIDEALFVKIDIYKPYLKNWTKKQRQEADDKILLPVKRPDVDNYVKSILDGSEGILFKDDSVIVSLLAQKHYSENARVEIRISPYTKYQKKLTSIFN